LGGELMIRYALIGGNKLTNVAAYLPDSYEVLARFPRENDDYKQDIVIHGEDKAGWTLDGYVLPRLASGLIFGKEIDVEEAMSIIAGTSQQNGE
jgi:hypothetical protein